MSDRPTYLIPFSVGILLAGLLIWLILHQLGETTVSSASGPGKLSGGPSSAPASPSLATAPAGLHLSEAEKQLLAEIERLLDQPNARENEAVLQFKDEASYRAFLARAGQAGVHVVAQIDGLRAVRVRYDSWGALQRDALAHPSDYQNVGANILVQIPSAPSQEQRTIGRQVPFGNTMLSFLGISGDHGQWGNGTTIAILDSGVLSDRTLQGRVRTLDIGLGTTPGKGSSDGHGTAVAALAAGSATDAPGVAPSANILSVRITDANGTSDIFTVAQGILAAVDAGAKIINISMGGYSTNNTLSLAIDYAGDHGAVIVAAAGNDQAAQLTWPAADPRVISVGAVDAAEQQVLFSNSGPQLHLTAPGYGVQTAWLDDQRVLFDGTSASAPIVAGAIAAIMSENPGLSATQAWEILQKYSSDGGAPGKDADYGSGILNVGWAMNRKDLTRIDTAVASHYFDATTGMMDYVVQNRSGPAVAGLKLNVETGGATNSYFVPLLVPGASYVVQAPVNSAALSAAGTLKFNSQLNNPLGLVDQVPGNNRKSSSLTVPAPGK